MLELKYPLALALTVIPLVIWLLQKKQPQQVSRIRTPLFASWQAIQTSHHASGKALLTKILLFLTWSLLVLAAARPQWIDEPIKLPISGRDLLLSIDVSGSMEEEDLKLGGQPVNRLVVVKSVINEFLKKREGDRVGLVLFGENAYLQTPLTFDLKTVTHMLNETEIGLAGASRTAIGDGIGLAVKRLRERPEQSRVLILLTDGRNNSGELDPIEAAKLAKHAGVKIYTIGVGADEAFRQSLLFGTTRFNPSAELDEQTLTQVANYTGGKYFRARSTQELAQIYNILDELEPVEDEPETYRPVQELYYYPALLALIIFVLPMLFRALTVISARKNYSDSSNYGSPLTLIQSAKQKDFSGVQADSGNRVVSASQNSLDSQEMKSGGSGHVS
ncbi:VWA domain-containing protein [Aliikangiella sp. G2MR2-5]|uniref:vWA domain-containing protein n=1 Tax=Aliikangiella sp. G2MR2-5 TaxID=2788943 RepID=UPI0018AC183F|nr:VWA domain-containing protein [Aliikangiella sp. G2MR2-5]